MTDIERAKKLIEEYCMREFEDAAVDFSRLDRIPIAFTTCEDEKHTIQVYANLKDCRIETYIDDELAETEQYTMDEMLVSVLPFFEFYALTEYDIDYMLTAGELVAEAAERSRARDSVQQEGVGVEK